ncbi:MIF4G domain containing protein, putative [Angomonas deanei]|uniref:MIF4G domain containing protein, putative n=1 Tax=Angomonas deanei TaxID=59799 RepID=A0A7G2C3B5_9TRYP|nr:MIF4G domain containing protein, putative [Angomonas deanei]
MLFNHKPQVKEEKPKNQMTVADILAFRDTWTDIPYEGFSLKQVIHQHKLEKQRKAMVPKLKKSENGFRIRKPEELNDAEKNLRAIQSSLNKLTEQNFDTMVAEMCEYDRANGYHLIYDSVVVRGAVHIIFSKAVAEPVFSPLYARWCVSLSNYEKELYAQSLKEPNGELAKKVAICDEEAKRTGTDERMRLKVVNADSVRFAIIAKCQEFYSQFMQQSVPEDSDAAERLRKQNMSNIKFVGELYLNDLVSTSVITLICCGSVGIPTNGNAACRPVTDIDLELVISLLNVVGKRYEELCKSDDKQRVWSEIEKYAADEKVSKRIHYLLQNMIDWRKEGWKEKNTAPLASSSANTEPHHNRNNNNNNNYNHNNNNMQRNMQSSNSLQQLDGARGRFIEPRTINTEVNEELLGELSDEELKSFNLAQPPKSITPAIEDAIIRAAQAYTDGDDSLKATITQCFPDDDLVTACMATVYIIAKKIVKVSDEKLRATLTKCIFNTKIWDESHISRGYSWCLAEAITCNLREDYPHAYIRFAALVSKTRCLTLAQATRQVIIRTANYLEALLVPLEGDEGEWEEGFLDAWGEFLTAWTKNRPNEVKEEDLLDAIGSSRAKTIFKDVMPDFIDELMQSKIITNGVLKRWAKKNFDKKDKVQTLFDYLAEFNPDVIPQ